MESYGVFSGGNDTQHHHVHLVHGVKSEEEKHVTAALVYPSQNMDTLRTESSIMEAGSK